MTWTTQRVRSVALLAAMALLWMGVDWGNGGCLPDDTWETMSIIGTR